MTLAEKIRKIREEKGMTQKQVASIMGISQQAYGQYESGTREPKPETLGRIALALGENIGELLKNSYPLDVDSKEQANYLSRVIHGQYEQAVKEQQIFDKVLRESPLAADLWDYFSILNEHGQQTAVERVQELTQIPQYQLENSIPQDILDIAASAGQDKTDNLDTKD